MSISGPTSMKNMSKRFIRDVIIHPILGISFVFLRQHPSRIIEWYFWTLGERRQFIEDRVEDVAEQIYNSFSYDGSDSKPEWVPGGNSLKQDEARKYARIALNTIYGDIQWNKSVR